MQIVYLSHSFKLHLVVKCHNQSFFFAFYHDVMPKIKISIVK